MVEYGNGVGQVAGRSGGGQAVDVGASVGQFVNTSVHTISTLPPAVLIAAALVLGFFILKRAF
jgi:hypothetical protein